MRHGDDLLLQFDGLIGKVSYYVRLLCGLTRLTANEWKAEGVGELKVGFGLLRTMSLNVYVSEYQCRGTRFPNASHF